MTLAGVVKEDLACPGSSLPEKRKRKRQASSSKQRLTMVQGSCRMYIERYIMNKETNGHLYIANDNLKRIADAIEEILRMVKTDQERTQEARAHYKMEEEQSE